MDGALHRLPGMAGAADSPDLSFSCRLILTMSTIVLYMKKIVLIATLLLLSFSLYSQEMKLYAPFPSRIKAETSGTDVVITWKDASDVEGGTYEIFRADVALTADNLYLAEKIGETTSGKESYSDTPQAGEELFYAVFVRDERQVYKICIPYRNVTTSPVSVEESDIEETKSTTISNLTTEIFDDDVTLSYDSSLEERTVIVFRSTFVIDSYEKLVKSVLVNEDRGSERSLIDNPMAGLSYYYAAVDGDLYRSGSRNLLYEGNYTSQPVTVKFSHEITEENRYVKSAMPLPLLKISADLESGEELEKRDDPVVKGSISSETLRSVNRLIDRTPPAWKQLEKVTLAYNRNINRLVTSLFAAGFWERCADELDIYTTSKYDEETRSQSHFYRGQCYFHLGEYNKALRELIMVEDQYYVETQPFLEAIYSIKRSERNS